MRVREGSRFHSSRLKPENYFYGLHGVQGGIRHDTQGPTWGLNQEERLFGGWLLVRILGDGGEGQVKYVTTCFLASLTETWPFQQAHDSMCKFQLQ